MTISVAVKASPIEGDWQPYLDELRLLFAEERGHLEIIRAKGKRSPEELRLKQLRLEMLGELGGIFAQCTAHQVQIRQLFQESKP